MRKLIGSLFFGFGFVFAFFVSGVVHADEVIVPVVTNDDFIQALLSSLGGFKGLGTLAIVGVVVQLLIKFLATPWAGQLFKKVSAKVKLAIVYFLTAASGVLSLMTVSGLTFWAALLHSSTLAALMVFGNQLWQIFAEGKDANKAEQIALQK